MHPGFKYSQKKKVDFEILKQDDVVCIGNYSFSCIETPGHTPGHMCLYESSKKVLVSGDHILGGITPNISLWDDDWDPLGVYLKSLEKVGLLDVELVLQGHRGFNITCRERIQELKLHHQERANEVLAILSKGDLNGYQVATLMTLGDVSCLAKMVCNWGDHCSPQIFGGRGQGAERDSARETCLHIGETTIAVLNTKY